MKSISLISSLVILIVLAELYGQKEPQQSQEVQVENQESRKWPSKSIHLASAAGDVNQVQLLISSGVDINSRDSSGNTPLHLAARRGHKEIVEILLDKGAEVNPRLIR